jgi:hypothetical protein
MPRTLSDKSVDRLIELARLYCEARAAFRPVQEDGRLTPQERSELCRWLSTLEERISTHNCGARETRAHSEISKTTHSRKATG